MPHPRLQFLTFRVLSIAHSAFGFPSDFGFPYSSFAPRPSPPATRHWIFGLSLLLLAGPVMAADEPVTNAPAGGGAGWSYRHLERTEPRPLHIHVIEADLSDGTLRAGVRVAPDPDGAGPAEAELTRPDRLAVGTNLVAAVNANAFGALPAPVGKRAVHVGWTNRMPVGIAGWAVENGVVRSPPENAYASVRVDDRGRVAIGAPNAETSTVTAAAAGFGVILRQGVVPAMDGGRATTLHPRTAAGVDAGGRRLWLVVVDGRRPGYSEGMSEAELGGLMKELGAADAVNLDGGGSSILLCDPDGRGWRAVNRPSDGRPRPVPVMLVVERIFCH